LAELASDPDDDFEFSQKMAHHLQGPNGREGELFCSHVSRILARKIKLEIG
jgi:hypothetical protein